MSCVVGLIVKNRVYLGCDSIGSDENCQVGRKDPKIFRIQKRSDALIGFVNSFRMGQILQYTDGLLGNNPVATHKYVVTKIIPKIINSFDKGGFTTSDPNGSKSGGQFLFAFKNKLFSIDNDFQVGENSCGYEAIGGGYAYALGSLYSTSNIDMKPEDRVFLALKAASEFGMGIGAPFHVFNTFDNKELLFEK